MPIPKDASEKQLQLEGATLASIDASGGSIGLKMLGAGIYHEDHVELFEASLVVSGSGSVSHPTLPSEIADILISLSGIGSWGVFVPFPFSITGHCQVQLTLMSGERVAISGASCHIELGQSTCHAHSFEPHNGA